MTTAIGQKEDEYKRQKKELTGLKSSTSPLNKEEREINNNISNRTKEILNQEKLVKKLNTELEGLKQEQKKQKDDEKQFEAAARKITGTEIVPERTVKQLNAKIMQLQKKIKNKPENQDYQEFLAYFQDMKERYVDMRGQIERLENLLSKIETMNNDRLDNFQIIRNIISNNVRRRFNAMIANFAEQIGCQVHLRIFNFFNLLSMLTYFLHIVSRCSSGSTTRTRSCSSASRTGRASGTAPTCRGSQVRANQVFVLFDQNIYQMNIYPGGEKSFTQMCLICALWDMMEPPFRCLDEWDVFLVSPGFLFAQVLFLVICFDFIFSSSGRCE